MPSSFVGIRPRWAAALLLLQLVCVAPLEVAQAQTASGAAGTASATKPAAAPTGPTATPTGMTPVASGLTAPTGAPPVVTSQPTIAEAACAGDPGPTPSIPTMPTLGRLQGAISLRGQEAADASPPKKGAPKVARPSKEALDVTLTLVDRSKSNRYVDGGHIARCSDGRFAYWIEAPAGSYDLTIEGKRYESQSASDIALHAKEVEQVDFSLVEKESDRSFLILLLPALFLGSIWLIRWNNIAKPSRLGVLTQLGNLKSRHPPPANTAEIEIAQKELNSRYAWLDWLFWSRGQEMASWNLIHKTELALLESAPPEKVNARLGTVAQRLAEIDKSGAKSLAERIAAESKCEAEKVNVKARQQLLIEASSYVYDASDTEFASLTSWQNKAFWLTLVGVMLITAVGIVEGHTSLFLAGGVGGFLSRLTRQLKRADVPTDYGASWSSLFLSPVAGAIMGWFGVALIMLLSDPDVGVLGGPLKIISWDSSKTGATLAAAFVLGFSERLFDKIVAQLEESIDKKKDDAKKATTNPAAAPQETASGSAGSVVLQLASLDPPEAVVGQAQQLKLIGTAFTAGSMVQIGNTPARAPLNWTATKLEVKLAAEELKAAGNLPVVVINGDQRSNSLSLKVKDEKGAGPSVAALAAGAPAAVAAGAPAAPPKEE